MREMELRERLRSQRPPDEPEAEERSWRVVQAAYAERRPVVRRGRLRRAGAVALAGAAAIVLAVTPAGAEIGDAIDRVFSADPPPRREVAVLPAAGSLLVDSEQGSWVVRRDGSRRLLGGYEESSWSPRGLFVVATRGRDVVALEPGGAVRWSITAPARAANARWAPSGFRIAYRSGDSLRAVAGDGTGDRLLLARAAPAAPAWRPGTAHVLAAALPGGRVVVVDADSRRRLWVSGRGPEPTELHWSADGRRLVAPGRGGTRVFDGDGRLLSRIGAGAPVALARSGHALAFTRPLKRGHEVVVARAERDPGPARRLFVASGPFSSLEWSPDGRWLMVAWPRADQWVLIRSARVDSLVSVTGVSRRFDPGGLGPEGFPRVAGWCCP